jgi:DNA-binding NarL/FixJ family response regulator
MSGHSIDLLVADDHAMFRAAVGALLASQHDLRVVGEAGDGASAIRLARELRPDLLLLDLVMPAPSGLDVLRELHAGPDACPTMMLTAYIDDVEMAEALRLGARGIMMKSCSEQLLFQGIRAIHAGQTWLDPRLATSPGCQSHSRQPSRATLRPRRFGLTRRELQVVGAVVAGYGNREIAAELSMHRNTVKHHLTNIFDKLGVSSRLELALFACHHRLVDVGTSRSQKEAARVAGARRRIIAVA